MSKVIELFAGPGGMAYGADAAGFDSVGIEWDRGAVATRRAALLPTIHADVRLQGPNDFPGASVLAAGSPCQTFTVAGRGEGRTALAHLQRRAKFMAARESLPDAPLDERSLLVLEPLRWILEAADHGSPYRAVVLEQVQQALPVWHTYADLLRAEGYHVATGVVRAEEYGVPQTRRRAVLAARLDADVQLPVPTHGRFERNGYSGTPGTPRPRTMGDVLPHRGPFTVVSNYGTGGDARNRGRRTSDQPAFTVTGKISRLRILNPDGSEQPRLTASEAGLLQGFPADWPWTGTDIPQRIGDACPPPLAAALFRAVAP